METEIVEAHINDDENLIGRWFVESNSKAGYWLLVTYQHGVMHCTGEWCSSFNVECTDHKPCRHMRLVIEKVLKATNG